MPETPPHPADLQACRPLWRADLARVAARDRWGRALAGVGWIHLGVFLGLQALHDAGDRTPWHYVSIWGLELAAVLAWIRRVAGAGWHRATPLTGLIARIWGTFLLLSLNLATLNTLSGLDHEWFKPALATLSIFGFAMMGYLVDVRFFLPAAQMYFTGLLMVCHLDFCYLIYGVSWWAALVGIAGRVGRRSRRPIPAPHGRTRARTPADAPEA